jgi:hypothetical protein
MTASDWHELPAGADIAIRGGITYAIIASVSRNYPEADIKAHVPTGIEVTDYDEDPARVGVDPNSSHRLVAVRFTAHQDVGTLPSRSPWPTTIYHLVRAWWSSGSPTSAPVVASSDSVWPRVLAVVAIAGVAYFLGVPWLRSGPRKR